MSFVATVERKQIYAKFKDLENGMFDLFASRQIGSEWNPQGVHRSKQRDKLGQIFQVVQPTGEIMQKCKFIQIFYILHCCNLLRSHLWFVEEGRKKFSLFNLFEISLIGLPISGLGLPSRYPCWMVLVRCSFLIHIWLVSITISGIPIHVLLEYLFQYLSCISTSVSTFSTHIHV